MASRQGFLRRAIDEIRSHREVHEVDSVDAALQDMRSGKVDPKKLVCFVCARLPAIELASKRASELDVRPLPLVCITRDARASAPAAKVGTVVVIDPEKLAARVVSLPNLATLRAEAAAGLFLGETTDLRFGHKGKLEKQEFSFTQTPALVKQSLKAVRGTLLPVMRNYDKHIAHVTAYIKGLCPVHRCKPGTFLAVLREGGLLSREGLVQLIEKTDPQKASIIRCSRSVSLQNLARRTGNNRREVFKYAEGLCAKALASIAAIDDPPKPPPMFSIKDGQELVTASQDCARACIELSKSSIGGIGFHKDQLLGTPRHVFSTLGPNTGAHYGSVSLILKPSILYHPSVWISPVSATGFLGPSYWAFKHRPWGMSADPGTVEGTDEGTDYFSGATGGVPENDDLGVDACLNSSLNFAAAGHHGFNALAREVDAMCQVFLRGKRDAATYDGPYTDEDHTRKAKNKYLAKEDKYAKEGWREVIEYYESKDSHTLCEVHLPGFVPLAAIDRIIIPDDLYNKHTEIKATVDKFKLPDGRLLKDMVTMTKSLDECTKEMHNYFENRRACLPEAKGAEPMCVLVSGRQGKPCILPRDFPGWACHRGGRSEGESPLRLSFCCRASHDIRVVFSNTPQLQREDVDITNADWAGHFYEVVIGFSNNSQSYVARGCGKKESNKLKQERDSVLHRCWSCGVGMDAIPVWERYWFEFVVEGPSKSRVRVRCGRGPLGEDVMLDAVDTDPIKGISYVGLSCWREPTVYCDLHVPV